MKRWKGLIVWVVVILLIVGLGWLVVNWRVNIVKGYYREQDKSLESQLRQAQAQLQKQPPAVTVTTTVTATPKPTPTPTATPTPTPGANGEIEQLRKGIMEIQKINDSLYPPTPTPTPTPTPKAAKSSLDEIGKRVADILTRKEKAFLNNKYSQETRRAAKGLAEGEAYIAEQSAEAAENWQKVQEILNSLPPLE